MEPDDHRANHEFEPDIADDILTVLEDSDLSYPNAVNHLCSVIAGICIDRKFAIKALNWCYDMGEARSKDFTH